MPVITVSTLTPIRLISIEKGINKRWTVGTNYYDLASVVEVKELYQRYRKMYIESRLSGETTNVFIDMAQFTHLYADSSLSISDMFLELSGVNVDILREFPTIKPRHVAWNDAFRAGYNISTCDRTLSDDSSSIDKKDALLKREVPYTSYKEMIDYCLFTVNGLFHFADTDTIRGTVIYDANVCLKKSSSNQIGILSFKQISQLKCYPITPEMIRKRDDTQSLKSSGYLKLPVSANNKTVFLVLGGYLITPDTQYLIQTGEDEFCIDFNAYPLLDRYYDSLDYLDLSSMVLSTNHRNETQRVISELQSDENITALFKLSQSFFVVIDSPYVYVEKSPIHQIVSSGIYRIYKDSNYPLQLSTGRYAEYWKTKYDNFITLTVDDAYAKRRVYNKTNLPNLPTATSAGISQSFLKPTDAHLIEIGADM